MSDRYYLTDGAHVLMAGSTGSGEQYGGKTTTLNWWQDQLVQKGWLDASIYVTPKRGERIKNASTVSTLKGLAESWRSGSRQLHFETQASRMDTEALTAEHERVIETVKRLPGEKVIVHDECHAYQESDGLAWCLTEAGNLKEGNSIRSLCGTQRPWNLREELRNCLTFKCWVGPLTSEGEKYFKTESMNAVARELRGQMEPYAWAVTDGGELIDVHPPVPAKYA